MPCGGCSALHEVNPNFFLKKRNIMCPPFSNFLEQSPLFLDLLTSFIKPFKTSDFSEYVSHVLT